MRKVLIMAFFAASALARGEGLAVDPNLHSKTLPNGVEIVAYKNSEPPNRVSMRLVVKRGSACESESERGLAHFVEHMAFKGTKNFPSGDMVEYFQRLGMAFGADTNAYTSFEETVYKLDMPDTSKKLLEDGITLLRDYAGEINFDAEDIESERGVIIAEKKARESQEYRRAVAEIKEVFGGVSHADRLPIGEEKVILSSGRDAFLKFYRETYRPENMVVVIVGDVDPEEMIALAEKKFSDLKPFEGSSVRPRYFGNVPEKKSSFDFTPGNFSEGAVYFGLANASSAYAGISVARELNLGDSPARREFYYKMRVVSNIIGARMLRVSSRPDSKITSGYSTFYFLAPKIACFIVGAESPVGKVGDALAEVYRRMLEYPSVSAAEVEEAKKKLFSEIEDAAKARETMRSPSVADELASAYADEEVYTTPEFDLKLAKKSLENFGLGDAVEILREWFGSGKIKTFISDAAESADGNALAEAALSEAKSSTLPSSEFSPQSLKFSDFGKPGKIASREELADLGIVRIRFENGVRLNIKKTDFAKDEIITRISFGNGLMDLPSPEYYFAVSAIELGGTKMQTASELQSAKFGRKLSIMSGIRGNSFFLANSTTVRDFPDMVRLAATFIRDAAFREDSLPVLQKRAERAYLELSTNPAASLSFVPLKLLNLPSLSKVPGNFENFKKISMGDISKWMDPILKKSYMEISVAGAVDPESAIKLFSETFGSGGRREESKKNAVCEIAPVGEGSRVDIAYDSNGEPRSVAAKIWKSCGKSEMEELRRACLLGEILDDVLRKEIRESEGKVYSPFAYNSSSDWVKDWGILVAMTMVAPEFNSEVSGQLEKCAEKIRGKIDEDSFERAKLPLLKQVEAGLRKNSYWCENVLDLSQARPFQIELARTIVSGYQNLTLAELEECSKRIFGKKPFSVSVMPSEK